jgi:hypothetical protein
MLANRNGRVLQNKGNCSVFKFEIMLVVFEKLIIQGSNKGSFFLKWGIPASA